MNYQNLWLAFVRVVPQAGTSFTHLLDEEYTRNEENYLGAWANVIAHAADIPAAVEAIKKGLAEMNLVVEYIDSVQNVQSLVEHEEVQDNITEDADRLLKQKLSVVITDRLYPYVADEDDDDFEDEE